MLIFETQAQKPKKGVLARRWGFLVGYGVTYEVVYRPIDDCGFIGARGVLSGLAEQDGMLIVLWLWLVGNELNGGMVCFAVVY